MDKELKDNVIEFCNEIMYFSRKVTGDELTDDDIWVISRLTEFNVWMLNNKAVIVCKQLCGSIDNATEALNKFIKAIKNTK